MSTTVKSTIEELTARVGLELGASDYRLVTPAALPVGERVRMRAVLDAVELVPGGAQLSMTLTFERDGGGKAVCVAQTLYRIYDER
jgi:hypothetical protein